MQAYDFECNVNPYWYAFTTRNKVFNSDLTAPQRSRDPLSETHVLG
jgi:hypothetical protein